MLLADLLSCTYPKPSTLFEGYDLHTFPTGFANTLSTGSLKHSLNVSKFDCSSADIRSAIALQALKLETLQTHMRYWESFAGRLQGT